MKTTAEHIFAAVSALDDARCALEALTAAPCGDADIDQAVAGALEDIEAQIGTLAVHAAECV